MEIPPNVPAPASGAERREWDRLPISIPFFVRGSKSTGEAIVEFATALDVSAGGVLLATKRYLEPNTLITLEVPIALAHKAHLPYSTSLLHATVLRCTPERQYFLLGLQFEQPLIAASSVLKDDVERRSACYESVRRSLPLSEMTVPWHKQA
jgi:hypothetical protein